MKKVIALLMAVMMLGTVAAGCGDSETGGNTETTGAAQGETTAVSTDFNVTADAFGDEKDATIKVWGPDAYVSLLKEQCDAFKAKFPEQNISIEVVAQGEDTAATQMLSDPDAAADVFGFASDQLNRLVNAKVISPINTTYAANVAATDLEEAVKVSG